MVAIDGYATTYEVIQQGSGAAVQKGTTVTVHATGVIVDTGVKFWSTKDPGQQPFTYTAGAGGDFFFGVCGRLMLNTRCDC